jgi:hypothetical protein
MWNLVGVLEEEERWMFGAAAGIEDEKLSDSTSL